MTSLIADCTVKSDFIFTYDDSKPGEIKIRPYLVSQNEVHYNLPFVEGKYHFKLIMEFIAFLAGCQPKIIQDFEQIRKIAFGTDCTVANNPNFFKVRKGFLFIYYRRSSRVEIYTSPDKARKIDYERYFSCLKQFSDFGQLIDFIASLTGTTARPIKDNCTSTYSIELV